jgi:multidrug efflux pump subunit AcrB
MWIVKLALDRPYTFVVVSLLIIILSVVAIVQTPVDVFPNINIPVVGVIVNYGGLSPEDMQDRLANVLERFFTTTVSDIEHMEAQNYHGISVIKVFFQPGTEVSAGMAQISASAGSALRSMPPGAGAPFMISYSAADVPVLQLGISSKTLSEQQLGDLTSNFLRTQLATGGVRRKEPAHHGGPRSAEIAATIDFGCRSGERRQRAESGRTAGDDEDRHARI